MAEVWDLLARDETGFLARATPRDLGQAAAYFRHRARLAETPQERDFFADRAYQFALRAVAR